MVKVVIFSIGKFFRLSEITHFLRARPDTEPAERRQYADRCVQLSTTDDFCRKNGKYSTIKYCISCFSKTMDFCGSDVVLNSTTFSIFSAKNISST